MTSFYAVTPSGFQVEYGPTLETYHDAVHALEQAQGMFAHGLLILDSRTLQSTPESGWR